MMSAQVSQVRDVTTSTSRQGWYKLAYALWKQIIHISLPLDDLFQPYTGSPTSTECQTHSEILKYLSNV